jgi:nucleoside 2-deoxyribosyltransferase
MLTEPKVYLAGPDVFLSNARDVATAKVKLCSNYGFVGISPVDNELGALRLPPAETMKRISSSNEYLIRTSHLVIANLTPFRGPSMDVGTAYEVGFARALGLPVFGYSNVEGTLLQRTRYCLGAKVSERPSGNFEDSYQMMIENFDGFDNLMLVGALLSSGTDVVITAVPDAMRFTDLSGFEACLKNAAQTLQTLRIRA